MPAAGELRCVDAAIESVLEDIDSAFILKEEHRTSLHGFVPVTPEAEAPRCAKAASRCFSLRCDRHKVLTWEWMGASCYLRLGAALKRPCELLGGCYHWFGLLPPICLRTRSSTESTYSPVEHYLM
ncbi:unnamed protein product [Pleuronectes platessa]|uniref:Uncharacterized protein n=1 Tax=Pleuronectes platessa TaxID=8262 RepID=A0A9N7U5J2_PLEPL|nr:unnamed protein product [Pleuronectes platessa]